MSAPDPKQFAFPSDYATGQPSQGNVTHQHGVTKAEYFAGMALQGLCANPNVITKGGSGPTGLQGAVEAVDYARVIGEMLAKTYR